MDMGRDIIGIFSFGPNCFVGTKLQRRLQALQTGYQAARRSRTRPQSNASPKKTQVAFHSMWTLPAISSSERQSCPTIGAPQGSLLHSIEQLHVAEHTERRI
ncbi:Piso0_003617 [Millerozyma farinosa CBS 7064]|uniref:Piso0_003617 protein n=1 Tax=Pichia sorbitophila (strain ATCC MYA-4447 / BCRC 22081 / CBS 7064 / NBRC 10061 / NRRL Y-12695) TaxID=559304 RepID=G8YJK5_PICSO|nr:Piso0_003617 [Millerozyma farinosa CBS 7064]CCE81265.1 Piso0_003617 [Millerozyma farinosa CBS 7064]